MRRRFYDFNNRFRTTKNTEVIVFDKGGFVGPLGLVENFIKDMLKLIRNFVKNQPLTASDKTHLYGYLNPYYRSTYYVPKRRK